MQKMASKLKWNLKCKNDKKTDVLIIRFIVLFNKKVHGPGP